MEWVQSVLGKHVDIGVIMAEGLNEHPLKGCLPKNTFEERKTMKQIVKIDEVLVYQVINEMISILDSDYCSVNRNKVVSAELKITAEYLSLTLNLTDGLTVTVEEITYEPDTWDIVSWAEPVSTKFVEASIVM